jgi:hypothetical protein
MTIWLLAILLLGCLAAVGYTQGAIRVAISFFGIIIAALLAVPLAKLVKPAVVALGVKNPVWQWIIPPFVVFVVVLAVFKIVALAVHKKVDVHYKYKTGDLRLALWERLNARLGACLGLLNGLAYLVLICWVIYPFSYWTKQMASDDKDPKTMRFLNKMGHDLQATGMSRVARAVDGMPEVFYEAADLAGLLYQNPLLEARLSRYPAFLALAEKPEFQAISQDQSFSTMRLSRAPLREVLANPNISAIVNNPDQVKTVWGLVAPDLKDLNWYLSDTNASYFANNPSGKYTEKILGRWYFDVNAAMRAYRRAKPNLPSSEMQKIKRWMTSAFLKTMMVAAPDGSLNVKNLPQLKTQGNETQNLEGSWKSAGDDYQFDLGSAGQRKAKIDPSGRLVIAGDPLALVFAPED